MQEAVEASVDLDVKNGWSLRGKKGVELAREAAVHIRLAGVEVHRSVLLRKGAAVRGRALPGKAQVDDAALAILRSFGALLPFLRAESAVFTG